MCGTMNMEQNVGWRALRNKDARVGMEKGISKLAMCYIIFLLFIQPKIYFKENEICW